MNLASVLCNGPAFEQHSLQLQADHALSAALLSSLLSWLDRAAVTLRLPLDRLPDGGLNRNWVDHLAAALASGTLQAALERHAAAADDASLLSLLRSAAAVLQRLPATSSAEELCAHFDVACLVAVISQQIRRRRIQGRAAVTLLPLLPSLTSTLQLGARLGFASVELPIGWGPHVEDWACIAFTALEAVAGKPAQLPGGAASAPAFCAAGAEGYRVLPLLAAAVPHVASYPRADHPVVHCLARALVQLAGAATSAALQHTEHNSSPSAETAHAAALLFEANCRAVHWAVGQATSVAELLPGMEHLVPPLLVLLGDSFNAVAQVELQGSG